MSWWRNMAVATNISRNFITSIPVPVLLGPHSVLANTSVNKLMIEANNDYVKVRNNTCTVSEFSDLKYENLNTFSGLAMHGAILEKGPQYFHNAGAFLLGLPAKAVKAAQDRPTHERLVVMPITEFAHIYLGIITPYGKKLIIDNVAGEGHSAANIGSNYEGTDVIANPGLIRNGICGGQMSSNMQTIARMTKTMIKQGAIPPYDFGVVENYTLAEDKQVIDFLHSYALEYIKRGPSGQKSHSSYSSYDDEKSPKPRNQERRNQENKAKIASDRDDEDEDTTRKKPWYQFWKNSTEPNNKIPTPAYYPNTPRSYNNSSSRSNSEYEYIYGQKKKNSYYPSSAERRVLNGASYSDFNNNSTKDTSKRSKNNRHDDSLYSKRNSYESHLQQKKSTKNHRKDRKVDNKISRHHDRRVVLLPPLQRNYH